MAFLIEGRNSEGYRSILLHKSTDRVTGQEELKEAYGSELAIAPKAE